MTNQNLPSKLLIVDDDPSIALGITEPLLKYNVQVLSATNLESALYLYNQNRLDVAFIELEFEPLPGLALIQKWRNHEIAEKRMTGFVVISGQKRQSTEESLIKELGEVEIIYKPFTVIQVLPFLSRALVTKQRMMNAAKVENEMMLTYKNTGSIDKAAEILNKNPATVGTKAFQKLISLYEEFQKYEDAHKVTTSLLEKNQNDIWLINTKGRLLMKMGRFDEAKAAMEKADSLAPQNIERVANMAEVYLKLNKPDQSVKKMKELVALNPEQPDMKFDLFAKLFDNGFDQHADDFCKETTKPMEIVRYYNNKGVLLSKSGHAEESLKEYYRAVRFYPTFKENYRVYLNIAIAHVNQKTPESLAKAKEAIEKCLQLNPNFEKAMQILQTIQKRAS